MKYYNVNPLGKITGDCAYRGVSFFLGVTWIKAVMDLVCHTTDKGMVNFTYVTNITSYMAKRGYLRQTAPKGMTVADFIRDIAKPGKAYLIALRQPRHITVVDTEGELVDTWDCSEKVVHYYWER